MVVEYLKAQIRCGVNAVQLFDSWVGCLSPADYSAYVGRYSGEIFRGVGEKVPRIHFCANSSALLEEFAGLGCDVLSVDWRVPIGTVWERSGGKKGVQGNLDPTAAAAGGRVMENGVKDILRKTSGRRGHIFNLGHGVLKETPPENLKRIADMVHRSQGRK